MDCQKLVVYAIILIVGIYVLKDICGVKLPFIEGFDAPTPESGGAPFVTGQEAPQKNED